MTAQTEIAQKGHLRAVRFFWCFLIGATTVSLVGNVAHAVLPFVPHVMIQIGAAAVPPIALLAAVHGIALAVRAGASGPVYRWAVVAVGAIGVGAFSVSFLALRDLMHAIGYSSAIAWVFPAIIDTTVAVSTMMLVALGDKPAGRSRAVGAATARITGTQGQGGAPIHSAETQFDRPISSAGRMLGATTGKQTPATPRSDSAQTVHDPVQSGAATDDANLASDLRASRVTTQPVETVIAVLAARRDGATINAAAKASGVNYRTAQRIVEAAAARQQHHLAAAG
ncbi:hypothetical protein ASD37_25725 [Mycobacterium sp. Root135]|uniref:DUF2637 domain-containing protein n=1 Tax=Mycobacterium sp. Root135 TaxID=1736457 RepID=UPI0006FC8646|nr:DUF2637 domain-containing protein [Mycobacterium sp. Root135]KQY02947.1 hypothetical protein ASD37_25725 [Mycobacterium sp. Root135]